MSLTTNSQTPTVANMKIVKQVLAIFLLRICQLQAEEKVSCETTAGNFTIDLHRQWAPLGHDRFVEVPLLCVRCFCVCVGGQEIYNHARNSVLGLTTVCTNPFQYTIIFNMYADVHACYASLSRASSFPTRSFTAQYQASWLVYV